MVRFVAVKPYPGRAGILQPGSYRIPADISMGDAKAARADGYGHIERGEAPADPLPTPTPGGAAPAAMFSPDGGAPEHKEQKPARPLTTRKRRGGSPA